MLSNGGCNADVGLGAMTGGGVAAATAGAGVNTATTLSSGAGNANMTGTDNIDGCIYPDEVIMENGVAFNVRYTGCVEVKTSMKSLDFLTRTQVARECINRVCEAAGLKSAGKRRIDKKIAQYIAEVPCMQNAGTNVIINVSSRALNLINMDSGEIIASHQMPRISFASGGDADTLDFLAYIAKSEDEWRACYVLECIGGQSEDLIVTIGKAFMLRYNALSRKSQHHHHHHHSNATDNCHTTSVLRENDKEYYNDLPNKLPPDLLNANDVQGQVHQQQHHLHHQQHIQMQQKQHQQQQHKVSQLNLKKPRDSFSSNLIDLNSPPPDQTSNKINLSNFDPIKDKSTASNTMSTSTTTAATSQPPDIFDIPTFSLSAEVQRSQLMTESWYHAGISRPIAESLLQHDGDFLVRESQGKHGQYVLTGLAAKSPKHLLLIDPEGVVRTKDRIFESISHLINYHWSNSLPIISEDSELVLRNPIIRTIHQQTATQLSQHSQHQHQHQQQQHTTHHSQTTKLD